MNHPGFGYPAGVPANAPAVWGARGIIDGGRFLGLLHDRQGCWAVDDTHRAALDALLNDCRVLEIVRRVFTEKCDAGEIRSDEPNEVVLYSTLGLTVIGNSNGSHGYFYVSAFLHPYPEGLTLTDRIVDTAADKLTWSRDDDDLPEVGDEIFIGMNGLGPAVVVGYCTESHAGYEMQGTKYPGSHYLYLLCHLTDPPEWWAKDAKRRFNDSFSENTTPMAKIACIMGREWERSADVK
jgi:hypothetical protein